MALQEYGVMLAGRWCDTDTMDDVVDKYTGETVGRVGKPSTQQVDEAVRTADTVMRTCPFPPEERIEVLRRLAVLTAERFDELTAVHTAETGFTLRESRVDLERAVRTLELCAEEVKRFAGEVVSIDWYPGAAGRTAHTQFRPVGPVVAITPFNSPFNTVAHKVGPALSAGNAVILKPAVQSPLSAAAFADLCVEAGLPDGYLNVVFGGAPVGQQLTADSRVGFYAFTGSSEVGRRIASSIGLRRAQLELGSLASTIVCRDADPALVAAQVAAAGYRKAGQVCTSVQRLIVHENVFDDVAQLLAEQVGALRTGDPRAPETQVGPVIDQRSAERAASWVAHAASAGATVLAGGRATGSVMAPTLVADVAPEEDLVCQEVFAPVVSMVRFTELDTAIDLVNASPYGLAAGVFTDNYRWAREVAQRARVGTLQVNATSSNRYDSMPFGGVKDSGYGKEGPRYAMRMMSDEMLVIWN